MRQLETIVGIVKLASILLCWSHSGVIPQPVAHVETRLEEGELISIIVRVVPIVTISHTGLLDQTVRSIQPVPLVAPSRHDLGRYTDAAGIRWGTHPTGGQGSVTGTSGRGRVTGTAGQLTTTTSTGSLSGGGPELRLPTPAAASPQGSCPRGGDHRGRTSPSRPAGAVTARYKRRRSRRPCHPCAISSGHQRYAADNHGHSYRAGMVIICP
jgi:hypothetical protein